MAGEVARGSRVVVPFGRKKFYTAIVPERPLPASRGLRGEGRLGRARPPSRAAAGAVQVLAVGGRLLSLHAGRCLQGGLALGPEDRERDGGGTEPRLRGRYPPVPGASRRCSTCFWPTPCRASHGWRRGSGLAGVLGVVKSLIEREAVFVKEELRRSYKPRTESCVRLASGLCSEERLHELFDRLARAPPPIVAAYEVRRACRASLARSPAASRARSCCRPPVSRPRPCRRWWTRACSRHTGARRAGWTPTRPLQTVPLNPPEPGPAAGTRRHTPGAAHTRCLPAPRGHGQPERPRFTFISSKRPYATGGRCSTSCPRLPLRLR